MEEKNDFAEIQIWK